MSGLIRVTVLAEPAVREGGYRALTRHEGPLVLRFGWSRHAAWRTVRWTVAGLLFYSTVVGMGVAIEGWQSAIIPAVIGTLSIVCGAYIVLAQALNRTTITLDRQQLHWEHGPLSYEPGGEIPIEQIVEMKATRASAEQDYAHGLLVLCKDKRLRAVIPDEASFGGDAASVQYLIERLQERLAEVRASRGSP